MNVPRGSRISRQRVGPIGEPSSRRIGPMLGKVFAMRMISCDDRDAPFVNVFMASAQAAGYAVEMVRPVGAGCSGFQELKRTYRHLSPNPAPFELASFRRWFEIAAVVRDDERFVLADSDLVVCSPWQDLAGELRDAHGLVGSIGATGDILEDGINGGFSVWTGRMLRDFCDAMVAEYAGGADRLAAIHVAKVAAGHARASISDMTLLYMWVQENTVPFLNSNRLFWTDDGSAQYIDHNFFMPEALGVKFAMAWGRKALHQDAQGRLMLHTREGMPVRVGSLHLGGRYKILSEAIYFRRSAELMAKSAFIWGGRTTRTALRKVGVHV